MKRTINLSIISAIVYIFLSIGCDHSAEPKWDLDFNKMEIHYSKVGGWIQPTKSDIYNSGLARAFLFNHSTYTATDSASTVLSRKEQNEIVDLFQSFLSYERYYEPKDWITDQNTHTLVLIYDGIPDTVSVYMPDKADIPPSLTKIILEMEFLWAGMLNKN
jgi:hypothetical protein